MSDWVSSVLSIEKNHTHLRVVGSATVAASGATLNLRGSGNSESKGKNGEESLGEHGDVVFAANINLKLKRRNKSCKQSRKNWEGRREREAR